MSENKIAASKPKPPHRLQRDFGSQFRIETQIEETARLLSHRTIFRQIPSRLPHHPDRRHCFALAFEHAKQWLCPHVFVSNSFFHKI